MNGKPVNSEHTDVGAYALGLLEPQDRQAFEEHLAGCPACAAELAELSGMKGLLSDLGPVAAPDEPTEANVTDLVRRRAESQRRHTRRQVLLGAAAGLCCSPGARPSARPWPPSPRRQARRGYRSPASPIPRPAR